MNFKMACNKLGVIIGTHGMSIYCALFAMKAFGLALILFLSVFESQLIVVLSFISVSLVQSIRVWFLKRKRQPPESNKLNANIRPHSAHPIINNGCQRRRLPGNKNNNPPAAAMHGAAWDNQTSIFKSRSRWINIQRQFFSSFIYPFIKLVHSKLFIHPSIHLLHIMMPMPVQIPFLSECGPLSISVLCGPSQSHFCLRGSVKISRNS